MKLIWIMLLISCLLIISCYAQKPDKNRKPKKTSGVTKSPNFVYISNWSQYKMPSKLDVKYMKNILEKIALFKRLEYCPFKNDSLCTNGNFSEIVSTIIKDEVENINTTERTVENNNDQKLFRSNRNNPVSFYRDKYEASNKHRINKKNRSKIPYITLKYYKQKNRGSKKNRKMKTHGQRTLNQVYTGSKGDYLYFKMLV